MPTDRGTALAAYVRQTVAKDPRARIELDTPLITSGLVDSFSLVSVLAFIEDEFHVIIPDEAATAEAMNTVGLILQLIEAYAEPG
jgi:acyl carrier protein/D-alanine--poly(phosphoribitol) ligase subunit 2